MTYPEFMRKYPGAQPYQFTEYQKLAGQHNTPVGSPQNDILWKNKQAGTLVTPESGGSSTWSGSTLGDRFTDLSGTGLSNEVGGKLANAAYDNIGYSSNKYTPEYSKLGISQEQYNNLDTRSKFALDESQGNINADAFSYDKNLGKSPNLTGMEAAQVGLGLAGLAATIDNNKFNQRMARKNYGLAQDQFDVAKADIGYKDDGTTNRSRTQYSLGTAFA